MRGVNERPDLDQQPTTVFDTLDDGTVRVRFDKEHLGEAIVGAGQLGVVSFTPPVVSFGCLLLVRWVV